MSKSSICCRLAYKVYLNLQVSLEICVGYILDPTICSRKMEPACTRNILGRTYVGFGMICIAKI